MKRFDWGQILLVWETGIGLPVVSKGHVVFVGGVWVELPAGLAKVIVAITRIITVEVIITKFMRSICSMSLKTKK